MKVNEYFDSKVMSIGFESSGQRSSVGVMDTGEYTFDTAAPERMTVVAGEMTVKLPGNTEWQTFSTGDKFEVPGESSFKLQIAQPAAYRCDYL
ncbi:hypothetical protein CS022_16155 [Veronia nyctiphanis]|uniref:Pyrimidine/purine nucleoside phosphorylase n=1 Tax=Veronia nyctiphanis TaxID=1278244 RepID=A0A4Q0YT89_9GAMM|nr:pyrimidine/purine nucleoside phosphorylase [Veronia nyctiphanis]RXJ72359.1 hypothetical protein CS022_16155 [Veronia nyctiphanis]